MANVRRKVVSGYKCGGHANDNWFNARLECGHTTVVVCKYPKAPNYDYVLPKTAGCIKCTNSKNK